MNIFCRTLCYAGIIAITSGLICGCQKSDNRARRVPVSGTVLYQGQPVADATVLFDPVGGAPAATGQTDANGRYRLTTFDTNDGAAPGDYRVMVRKIQVVSGAKSAPATDDAVGAPPDEKWLLPVKYGHSESSGLTATVKENGENEFRFELQE